MILAIVVSILFVLFAYGAYLTVGWLRQHGREHVRALAASAGAVSVALGSVPTYAQTTLNFDITPFFEQLGVYLPVFIGIFAIVGGIAAAIALSKLVINAVVDAFKGGSM